MKRFTPNAHFKSIHKINLQELYDIGKRLILTDLDNTLACYNTHEVLDELREFIKNAKEIGFEVRIVSNTTNKTRVTTFCEGVEVEGVGNAKKPFKGKLRKMANGYEVNQVIMVGDQVMTDVWGGNRAGFYTILVDPVDGNSDKVYTKMFNRKIERRILRRLEKKGKFKKDE